MAVARASRSGKRLEAQRLGVVEVATARRDGHRERA